MSAETPLVPIRAACAMFHLNPNTLRAWERRYGIIQPVRGEGGQRGFSPHDIDVICQMVQMTREGIAPSVAAGKIRRTGGGAGVAAGVPVTGTERLLAWRNELTALVEKLDAEGMLGLFGRAGEEAGYQPLVEQVIFPELQRLGSSWHERPGTIAQEHCASMTIRTYLVERYLRARGVDLEKPHITLACVPGEGHDLPLLHLANLLADTGAARATVLASGLPLAETLRSASQFQSPVLLLSGTIAPSAAELREWTAEIIAAGWEEKCVLAGAAFLNSRIFSETKLRAAAGNYSQAVELLLEMSR